MCCFFSVNLKAQPPAPDGLRFQTLVSDRSYLGSCPRALGGVIQTGQMLRCVALANEKPERHKETQAECPLTEIAKVAALKTSSLPNSLLRQTELEENSRKF